MRVAVVLNTSWNIYNFRKGLILALLKNGYQVTAVAPKDEYSAKLIEMGCDFEPVKMDSRGANPLRDFNLTHELFRIYKRVKPDVILQYTIKPNIYGTLAASFLRIPVVNNVCGLGTAFLSKNLMSRVAKLMYKIAFRFPKLVFFQNQDDKDFFLRENLIRQHQTDVLPGSGIDINHFAPQNKQSSNKPFTFLLISRLIHDKGIIEFIKAIEILQSKGVDAKFEVLGQIDQKHRRGIDKSLIDNWIDKGIIDYLGTTDDVRKYINNSDCVVLPSYREGTPRSLLEAASSGKPIVTTNVAGCNNVVDNNVNGYLCEAKNANDLADKMELMVKTDPPQRERMGMASRKIAKMKFSENIVINKYLNAIATV